MSVSSPMRGSSRRDERRTELGESSQQPCPVATVDGAAGRLDTGPEVIDATRQLQRQRGIQHDRVAVRPAVGTGENRA